jgi:hypothetical protein
MADSDYARQYKDPRWQRVRLETMQRDDFACVECGDRDSTLNVHHVRYIRGVPPWAYPPWLLITLCESCHDMIHGGEPTTAERVCHVARAVGMGPGAFEWLEVALFQCVYTHAGKLTENQWVMAINAFRDVIESFGPEDRHGATVRESYARHSRRLYPEWELGG